MAFKVPVRVILWGVTSLHNFPPEFFCGVLRTPHVPASAKPTCLLIEKWWGELVALYRVKYSIDIWC